MDEVDIKIKWFPELKKYMVKVSVPFSTEFLTWAEKVNIDKPGMRDSHSKSAKDDIRGEKDDLAYRKSQEEAK